MFQRLTLSRTVRTLLIAAAAVVCLKTLSAQDARATVISQVGQISVMSDPRGGDATPLLQGMSIKPQQLIVSGPDGYAQFQVSDGSTFEVYSNARVVFRPTMGSWTDLLNVGIGRVKVWIQHAPNRVNHNQVSSPTAVISVRGTVFDVVVEDSDGTTLVTLDEGAVDVRNLTAAGNTVSLHPGDFLRVFRNQPLALAKPDHGNVIQQGMKMARDAAWQVLRNRQTPVGGVGVPGSGTSTGAQGDKGKGGTTTTTPGAPPTVPGAPPPPPGGGE